jgi:hypothetical protein
MRLRAFVSEIRPKRSAKVALMANFAKSAPSSIPGVNILMQGSRYSTVNISPES